MASGMLKCSISGAAAGSNDTVPEVSLKFPAGMPLLFSEVPLLFPEASLRFPSEAPSSSSPLFWTTTSSFLFISSYAREASFLCITTVVQWFILVFNILRFRRSFQIIFQMICISRRIEVYGRLEFFFPTKDEKLVFADDFLHILSGEPFPCHDFQLTEAEPPVRLRAEHLDDVQIHAVAPAPFGIDERGQSLVIGQVVGVFEPNHFPCVFVFIPLLVSETPNSLAYSKG